jgi:cell wall-associated NlpC family hydrolase
MGIIYLEREKPYVFEAIQPVKLTPLKEWIDRGENGYYVIKRMKNSDKVLNEQALKKMKKVGEKYKGKDYDIYFEWSDDKIYCSELVWKIYDEALGIEIGNMEQLSDFDLSNDAVKLKMKERYGDHVPMDEKVISPAAIYHSPNLIEVYSNEK